MYRKDYYNYLDNQTNITEDFKVLAIKNVIKNVIVNNDVKSILARIQARQYEEEEEYIKIYNAIIIRDKAIRNEIKTRIIANDRIISIPTPQAQKLAKEKQTQNDNAANAAKNEANIRREEVKKLEAKFAVNQNNRLAEEIKDEKILYSK